MEPSDDPIDDVESDVDEMDEAAIDDADNFDANDFIDVEQGSPPGCEFLPLRSYQIRARRPFRFGDRDVEFGELLGTLHMADETDSVRSLVSCIQFGSVELVQHEFELIDAIKKETNPPNSGEKSLAKHLTELEVNERWVEAMLAAGVDSVEQARNHFASKGGFSDLKGIGSVGSKEIADALGLS